VKVLFSDSCCSSQNEYHPFIGQHVLVFVCACWTDDHQAMCFMAISSR